MHADRTADVEQQLIKQGQIEDSPSRMPIHVHVRTNNSNQNRFDSSDGMSDRAFFEDSGADSGSFSDEGFPSGSDDIEPDLQSLRDAVPFDSVTDELRSRLRLTESGAAPLLLPPKDYDTVVRRHGDLDKANKRKCLQIPIVGSRNRNGSDESGIDVPSPTSSEGKLNSMDMSDDKISSSIQSSNGVSTPPTSPKIKYDIYSPVTTPRSPLLTRTSGYDQYPRKSRPVSSSGVHSNRSSENYSPRPDISSTTVYNGRSHITDIPPADYDNDNQVPIMRHTTGMSSHRDVTNSMPSAALREEIDYGYAVVPARINRHSSAKYIANVGLTPRSTPQVVDMNYEDRRGGAVRRVNSMYR